MTVQDLQKLWDDSGIELEFVAQGDHGYSVRSIVEQLDDGIFLSHFNGDEFEIADKLGMTVDEAEAKLKSMIAEYIGE